MKKIFLSKQAKIVVDILLVLNFFSLFVFYEHEILSWKSAHCALGSIMILLMILHIVQHWRFIKSLTKKKVIRRNKITALTTLCFILIFVSVLLFILGLNIPFRHFHHIIGTLFLLIIVIHTVDKFKRFISLFKK